jgi:hypothetical protein
MGESSSIKCASCGRDYSYGDAQFYCHSCTPFLQKLTPNEFKRKVNNLILATHKEVEKVNQNLLDAIYELSATTLYQQEKANEI